MPRQQDAEVGTDHTLEVQVVGFPVPEVRWFRNNKEITENPRYSFTFGIDGRALLTIKKMGYPDAGNYKVRAKNTYGTSINATKITVKCKSHRMIKKILAIK